MYVLFMLAKLLGPPTRKIISSTSEPKGQGNRVYTTWNAYPKIWEKMLRILRSKALKGLSLQICPFEIPYECPWSCRCNTSMICIILIRLQQIELKRIRTNTIKKGSYMYKKSKMYVISFVCVSYELVLFWHIGISIEVIRQSIGRQPIFSDLQKNGSISPNGVFMRWSTVCLPFDHTKPMN